MLGLFFNHFTQEPPGDILVFLTGQDDIDAAVELITEEAQNNGKPSTGMFHVCFRHMNIRYK